MVRRFPSHHLALASKVSAGYCGRVAVGPTLPAGAPLAKRHASLPPAPSPFTALSNSTPTARGLGLSPRDASALCTQCGQRGTWALCAFGQPSEIRRFCRECWPLAQRRFLDGLDPRFHAASAVASYRGKLGRPESSLHASASQFIKVHWLLIPATAWRSCRRAMQKGEPCG